MLEWMPRLLTLLVMVAALWDRVTAAHNWNW
jgi:hypothetical protein